MDDSVMRSWDGDTESLPSLDEIAYWVHRDFEIFESKFEAFWAGVALAEGGREKWQRREKPDAEGLDP